MDITAHPARTVAEQVYLDLKADLLSGAFPPGSALLTRTLLARYGCGISPLREALSRLTGEEMLEASGHRGVRVPVPSLADLEDVYRIRILLETEALSLSIASGDDEWEAQAIAACHRLERFPLPAADADPQARTEAFAEWERRHRAFHRALIAAAPAPRLLRLIDQMVDQTERYRVIRLVHGNPGALGRDMVAEHRGLLDSAIARSPRAPEELAEHLARTRRFVAELFTQSTRAP